MEVHVSLVTLLTLLGVVISGEVDLLNSKKLMTLKWDTHSSSGTRGWREATYMNGDEAIRVYTVCDLDSHTPVQNWLRLPYLDVNQARRVVIQITFKMRKCPKSVSLCKENLKLYTYQSDVDVEESLAEPWNEQNYQLVDVIHGSHLFSDATDSRTNTVERNVLMNREGVTFALVDEGSCMTLLGVRVYYLQCPATVVNMVRFPATPTGKELTSLVHVDGECIDHAGFKFGDIPSYICTSDGGWLYLNGACTCLAGYQETFSSPGICSPCSEGQFKSIMGDHLCDYCPDHSHSTLEGAAICRCESNYHRAENDGAAFPCTQPPSSIRELHVASLNERSVVLVWSSPEYHGGRDEVHYQIRCDTCGVRAEYDPSQVQLRQNSVTVNNLRPGREYEFTIYANNDVSHLSEEDNGVSFTIITKQGLPRVTKLLITEVQPTLISLRWSVESNIYDNNRYHVFYGLSGEEITRYQTDIENITLTGLQPSSGYTISVSVVTDGGIGDPFEIQVYTDAIIVTDPPPTTAPTTQPAVTQVLLTFPPIKPGVEGTGTTEDPGEQEGTQKTEEPDIGEGRQTMEEPDVGEGRQTTKEPIEEDMGTTGEDQSAGEDSQTGQEAPSGGDKDKHTQPADDTATNIPSHTSDSVNQSNETVEPVALVYDGSHAPSSIITTIYHCITIAAALLITHYV